jgi:CRP-like cAMP-binding protein
LSLWQTPPNLFIEKVKKMITCSLPQLDKVFLEFPFRLNPHLHRLRIMTLASSLTQQISSQIAKEHRRLHFYRKSEEIPILPQGIWQVDRGMVQVSTLCTSGDEVVLGWVGSSNYFGQSWFPSFHVNQKLRSPCQNRYLSYRGLSDVYLKWYNISDIETNSALAPNILPQLGKRLQQAESLLAMGGYRRVEDRLYQLLVLLTEEMGEVVSQGTRLTYRLTHQNLANTIGTTRVTVTRLLGKLQQEGCIELDARRHIILKENRFDS